MLRLSRANADKDALDSDIVEAEPDCNHGRYFPTSRNLVECTLSSGCFWGAFPKDRLPKNSPGARIYLPVCDRWATCIRLEKRQPVEEHRPAHRDPELHGTATLRWKLLKLL